jgi:hypothetical protein
VIIRPQVIFPQEDKRILALDSSLISSLQGIDLKDKKPTNPSMLLIRDELVE